MKRAVIYTRVSTKKQTEEGHVSLDTQEKACRKYCNDNSYEVIDVYADEGQSAKTLDRRALKKLLTDLSEHKIDVVVVYKMDRLTRNTADLFCLTSIFTKKGVELKSACENFDNTPEGELLQTITAGIAQMDNRQKSRVVKENMQNKTKQGYHCFQAPFGYRRDNEKSLAPDDNARFIITAFDLVGNKGFRPSEALGELYKIGCSKKVNLDRLCDILRNPNYKGHTYCKKWFGNQTFVGVFEPLVSAGLFDRVQDILYGKKNPLKYTRNNPNFPLKGTMYCRKCGKKLTGSASKGKYGKYYSYYHCKCGGFYEKREVLDKAFAEFLQKIKPQKELLDRFKKSITKQYKELQKIALTETKRLQIEIQSFENHKSKLTDKLVEGVISDAVFQSKLSEYDTEISHKQSLLQQYPVGNTELDECLEFCWNFLEKVDILWQEADLSGKQKIQQVIFKDKAFYQNGEVGTPKISDIFAVFQCDLEGNSLMARPERVELPTF